MTRLRNTPKTSDAAARKTMNEFIASGGSKSSYPWLDPKYRHREGVTAQLNIRIDELPYVKLSWLASGRGVTKTSLVQQAVEEFIEREFSKMAIPIDR